MSLPEEAVTAEVRSLYERYPFPGPYASEKPPALDGMCSYTFACYHAFGEYRAARDRWILDAGCGTGETLRRYALTNPGAHLVGYDLSEASLALAAQKIQPIQGVDVHFEQRDILQLPEPDRQYDLVSCTGVLHHLADPAKGLRNLVPYLKPDGLFACYLYSAYARREIDMSARIIRMLCGASEPLDKRIDVARRFFNGLPKPHFLLDQPKYETDVREWIGRDEHLADMFLHPREVLYELDDVLALLDGANLELVGFYDEDQWDLRRLLTDDELYRRTMFMSRRQKYRLADLLNPRPAYIFMARHKAYQPPPRSKDTGRAIPVMAPVCSWVVRRPVAAMPSIPPDTILEVQGFTSHTYRLDNDSVETLALCDGERTVEAIASARSASTGQDPAVYRRLLDTLEQQRIVLFKRS